jgi:predicted DNA repair protein MutK
VAGTSLLLLIDDIATTLDDVALMAKVAAKKTAGVLGDDLALNAEQVSGVQAERELPIVWAVCKGSLRNKIILVPLALALNAFAPWAVLPLLMLGGAYLCFEGFEKVVHSFWPHAELDTASDADEFAGDMAAFEKEKVSGAIRTDFILSAEIIVITLGTVATASFMQQVIVLSGIAFVMTVGVYGLVAAIVKLDDGGLYMCKRSALPQGQAWQNQLGRMMLAAAPKLMKFLAVAGTIAMFTVGGGILSHGVPLLHSLQHTITHTYLHGVAELAYIGPFLQGLAGVLVDAAVGVVAGAVVLAGLSIFKKLRRK